MFKTWSAISQEVDRTNELIRKTGFTGEITFRPPYGKKLILLPYYLQQQNIITITWDIEPETYSQVRTSPESIAKYVVDNAKPGSIILLHVLARANENARKAVPLVINALKQKGYQFVTVSELLTHKQ